LSFKGQSQGSSWITEFEIFGPSRDSVVNTPGRYDCDMDEIEFIASHSGREMIKTNWKGSQLQDEYVTHLTVDIE
jgi:hypothetical protein